MQLSSFFGKFLLFFSKPFKKAGKYLAALQFSDSAQDFKAMVKAHLVEIRQRAAASGFEVVSAKDNLADSGVDQGAHTHGAGLQRDVKSASLQPPALQGITGLTDRVELGMA